MGAPAFLAPKPPLVVRRRKKMNGARRM
ncbi:hypothetical protein AG1IA_06931 [Rhizoctonia solani AG-1 IA]|uniref:Uncharacterized protein n=1 Tax=Thanatephorus cucumeris (strain AG1-IA) TaxID=983506 RepID=L8WLI7_THACA|nr:hypothetical protein AG1IA_06931 [Rhizoctonia solani AG-1 IA]